VSRGSGEFESPGERDEMTTSPRNVLRPRFSPQVRMCHQPWSNAILRRQIVMEIGSFLPTNTLMYGALGGPGKRFLPLKSQNEPCVNGKHVAFLSP